MANYLDQDDSLALVFPDYYLVDVLKYLDLSKQDFFDIVNKHRNGEIWKKDSNDNWKLRFPLPEIKSGKK